jgi:hypothetical protein
VTAERSTRLLTDNRQDRLMIEAGVVEAGDKVSGARPRSCDANPKFSAEFSVSRGHESGHLFVTGLHKVYVALRPI